MKARLVGSLDVPLADARELFSRLFETRPELTTPLDSFAVVERGTKDGPPSSPSA